MSYRPVNNPLTTSITKETSARYCFEYDTFEMGNAKVPELWSNSKFQKELKRWDFYPDRFPQPILINAPTGSGKTTFVFNHLVPFAKSQNKSVLLLCNRRALNQQNKETLSENIGIPIFSERTLQDINRIDKFIVTGTYQNLDNIISDLRIDPIQRDFPIGYIVLDEIHFLTSDALFNEKTSRIFSTLLGTFPACQRLYLSATPEEVRNVIANEEYKLYQWYTSANSTAYVASKSVDYKINAISEYRFQPDYSYIRLYFCDYLGDLIPRIASSSSKWLVFVSKKSDGQELENELKKLNLDGGVFYVDADVRKKNPEIKRKISIMIGYEKFKEKVLISTSLLDNGINFHDDELENIVVDSVDPIQIKQMVGRKRRDNSKPVNVYIVRTGKAEILSLCQSTERIDHLLRLYRENPDGFMRDKYPHLTEAEHHVFIPVPRPGYSGFDIYINGYTQYKLDCQMGHYEHLYGILEMEGRDGLDCEVASWFRIEKGDWTNIEGQEAEIRKQIVEELERYGMNPASTDSDAVIDLDNTLWKLVQPIREKYELERDSESVGKGQNIRNIINKLSLPYEFAKRGKLWKVIPVKQS